MWQLEPSSATTRTRECLHEIVLFAQDKKDGKENLGIAPYAKSANTNLNGECSVGGGRFFVES